MAEGGQGMPMTPGNSGASSLFPNQKVGHQGRYTLQRPLGQGGMGVVWLAHDERLREEVALKFLTPQISQDPDALEDLRRETFKCHKLTHPNIIRIHDLVEAPGEAPFISMEYVDGPSLGKLKAQQPQRCFSWEYLQPLVSQLCDALDYAHSESVIHRDLKPANMMLDGRGRLKLADFGLAAVVSESLSRNSLSNLGTSGTPAYMSPQQMEGKPAQPTDDIYALGAMLYELLSSKPPFYQGNVLHQVKQVMPDPLEQRLATFGLVNPVPAEVGALIMACLAKDPGQRPQSAEAVAQWLGLTLGVRPKSQAPAPAGPAGPVLRLQRRVAMLRKPKDDTEEPTESGLSQILWWVAGGAVAVVLLIGGLMLLGKRSAPESRKPAATETKPTPTSTASQPASAPLSKPVTDSSAVAKGGAPTNMVLIPAGPFQMGDPLGEGNPYDLPVHTVHVSSFYMDQHEVTKALWDEVYQWGVSHGYGFGNNGGGKASNHPIHSVSWYDAVKWCNARSEKEGRVAAYYSNAAQATVYRTGQVDVQNDWVKWDAGYRLPTEAEWEKAARGGLSGKRFPWGDTISHSRANYDSTNSYPYDISSTRGRHPNYAADGEPNTNPVGVFSANDYGLYDMAGNVREWCWDHWDTGYYASSPASNPRGPKSGLQPRSVRGGSWQWASRSCRVSSRNSAAMTDRSNTIGFRCVLPTESTAKPQASTVSSGLLSTSPATATKAGGILAPPETRVAALTTTPKVGQVFTLPLGGNVTMDLMGIPPGEFLLGSTQEEQAWAAQQFGGGEEQIGRFKNEGEQPRKAAIKQGLWLGRTEVTVGQWKLFVAETGHVTDAEKQGESRVPGSDKSGKSRGPKKGVSWRNPDFGLEVRDDHPAVCVSWNDAMAFCGWLTNRERKTGRLAPGQVVRLPTEAEWEYACRAGTQTRFWWGDGSGKGHLNSAGNWDGFEFVAPVASFGEGGRNRFGVADTLGNVSEWCLDNYDATQAHGERWAGNTNMRVLRGGASHNLQPETRCASRRGADRSYSYNYIGFRVCVGVEVPGGKAATP